MPVGTAARLPRARHVLRLHGGYVDHMKQTLVVKLVLKTAVSPDHLWSPESPCLRIIIFKRKKKWKDFIYSLNFFLLILLRCNWHTSWWLSRKESACSAGDVEDEGLIPGLGRSPGERNGNSLQCSCLENPMDRGPWWTTVHGVSKSLTWFNNSTITIANWNMVLLKFKVHSIMIWLTYVMNDCQSGVNIHHLIEIQNKQINVFLCVENSLRKFRI